MSKIINDDGLIGQIKGLTTVCISGSRNDQEYEVIPKLEAERIVGIYRKSLFSAVECDKDISFDEDFVSLSLKTRTIDGKNYLTLELNSNFENNDIFIYLSNYLFDPEYYDNFRNNPIEFYSKIKETIGNYKKDVSTYSVLGELLTIFHIKMLGIKNFIWIGPDPEDSPHDIESEKFSFEVKSTLTRLSNSITISSIDQLAKIGEPPKDLYLYRYIFMKSETGAHSINSTIDKLNLSDPDRKVIEDKLAKLQLKEGKISRDQKYDILEVKKYAVDEDFPKITRGDVPDYIMNIKYEVNLSTGELQSETIKNECFN